MRPGGSALQGVERRGVRRAARNPTPRAPRTDRKHIAARAAAATLLTGALTAATVAAIPFGPWYGTLSGAHTVETKEFNVDDARYVHFRGEATGAGSNKLTVKLQIQMVGGGWETLAKIQVPVGSSGAGSAYTPDYTLGQERCRLRVSRKLFTTGLDYETWAW